MIDLAVDINAWQFLIPDNAFALGILIFLAVLFFVWLIFWIIECFRLGSHKKDIRNAEGVRILEDALKRQIAFRNSDAYGINRERRIFTEKQGQTDFQAALHDFSETVGIHAGSIVFSHVRAIFETGWKNTQLQVEPLIKNTGRRLFSRNGLLRSVLSLFIIIGLLGTLFGLAHSLAELLPLMPDGTKVTNTLAAQGLGKLLNQLRGAFAPSIWGVGLTILGVLLLSFYLKGCQSVIDELERLTLTIWVPQLYPNPFQQQLITLIETEDLIRQNRTHIQTVANFASNIKENLEVFGTELQKAKTSLANLNQSSSQINEFANLFAQSVGRLAPFQEELSRLYDKMMQDSKVFQEGVTQSLFDTTQVQRQARDTLIQQSEQLEKVIGRLHSYENAFVDSHEELDTVLKAVMSDAQKAYQDIGQRNQEIVEAIGSSLSVPLRGDLTQQLTTLNDILTTKLTSIVDRFGTFDTPIKSSAQRFEQIVATIDTRAGELMARLQHEYQKQNEANSEQLQKLQSLNQQLISFLETLASVTSRQETSYTALTNTLPGLEHKLITLNENLRSVIAEGFPSTGTIPALDSTGIEKQIKENTTRLLTELSKLVRISDEIRTLQTSQNGRRKDAVVFTNQSHQDFSAAHTMEEKESHAPEKKGIRSRMRVVWKKLTGFRVMKR